MKQILIEKCEDCKYYSEYDDFYMSKHSCYKKDGPKGEINPNELHKDCPFTNNSLINQLPDIPGKQPCTHHSHDIYGPVKMGPKDPTAEEIGKGLSEALERMNFTIPEEKVCRWEFNGTIWKSSCKFGIRTKDSKFCGNCGGKIEVTE